jgi:2-polyprenyl-3-methyl-5-hydroxy-6-metoxy-1,4-benzoquinol methylase
MNFSQRSYTKELLDGENIPRVDLYRNLKELDIINRKLGGHTVTLNGLRKIHLKRDRSYQILDIGCGGGDTLKAIAKWGRDRGFQFELTGVDLKADCIEYAKKHCRKYREIHFIQSDYRELKHLNYEFDIVISSLFCHHLTENEITELFNWGMMKAKVGFIMNDLHRHPLAYYSIGLLTRLFSRSYLVKNDAKLSVLRGFTKEELEALVPRSPFFRWKIEWNWAFRWLLIIQPE